MNPGPFRARRPGVFAWALGALIVGALALRLACWIGPGARDDAQYMAYAQDWLNGKYDFLRIDSVFAARPAVYAPVAVFASVLPRLWPDSASIYFLLMSGVQTLAAAGIGLRLGRREGLLAALFVAVFPLDVVFASQVMPDLPMAAWIAVGVWMLTRPPSRWTAIGAGVAFGLAAATKEFAVVAVGLVPLLLPWDRGWRSMARTAGLILLGFSVPLGAEIAWFAVHADPAAVLAAISNNARLEKNGNPDPAYYYRILLDTLPANPGSSWFGGLTWVWLVTLLVSVGAAVRLKDRAPGWPLRHMAFFAYWAVAYFLFIQYLGPLLSGRASVERMERFLIPLGLPLALGVATAFGAWSRRASRVPRIAAWAGAAGLASMMLWTTLAYAFPHEVVLSADWRGVTRRLEAAGIESALMDRDAAFRVTVFSRGQVIGQPFPEDRSLVDVPSSRYFVLAGNQTDRMRRLHEPVPSVWQEVARVPGPLMGPLATFDPVIYWTGPGPSPDRRLAEPDWVLRTVLDIGSAKDEREHSYRIIEPIWEGRRTLPLVTATRWYGADGTVIDDDGRSFGGYEEFVVGGLTPGLPIRIVKRLDANVPLQRSRVLTGGHVVGEFRSDRSQGRWLELTLEAPGSAVETATVLVREEAAGSSHDVNAFQFRVYQRAAR